MEKFKELGIDDNILRAIEDLGFEEPTDIQRQTIPKAIAGKDLIAGSATGSGKTLAFGAGIIQDVEKGAGIQALIMTPTRELAEQIQQSMINFSKYKMMSIVTVYGGVSINPQMDALTKADIVVGTPGRILDHLTRGTIDLTKIKHLVLDEADRMLDMGFIDDVRKIMSKCAKERQTLFFSATLPSDIRRLSERFMKDPEKISVECYVDPKKLHQVYYDVPNQLKFSLLVHVLNQEKTKSGLSMVFCNSRRSVDFVAKGLKTQGFNSMGIHGGLTQAKRLEVIEKFNSQDSYVLVCTDVAARGLDIPGVTHVYNYDIPNDSKQYVHRIGRTARAGESGLAVNLLCERDHDNFSRVLRDNDVKVHKQERPFIEKIDYSKNSHPRKKQPWAKRADGTRGKRPRRSNRKGSSSNRREGHRDRQRKD